MTETTTATRPQTAQLLVLLYQYVVGYTASHPALLPAVVTLREAAQLYGRDDSLRAFQKGVDAYQFLLRARVTSPDLPIP
jgi:hypothetical protein